VKLHSNQAATKKPAGILPGRLFFFCNNEVNLHLKPTRKIAHGIGTTEALFDFISWEKILLSL
jgi:hypothetical protein